MHPRTQRYYPSQEKQIAHGLHSFSLSARNCVPESELSQHPLYNETMTDAIAGDIIGSVSRRTLKAGTVFRLDLPRPSGSIVVTAGNPVRQEIKLNDAALFDVRPIPVQQRARYF